MAGAAQLKHTEAAGMRDGDQSAVAGCKQEEFVDEKPSASVSIAALTHDLLRKRSIVTLVWDDDPEKRVTLPVPFGCSLDDLHAAAEKALRALAAETAVLTVNRPR